MGMDLYAVRYDSELGVGRDYKFFDALDEAFSDGEKIHIDLEDNKDALEELRKEYPEKVAALMAYLEKTEFKSSDFIVC